MKKVLLINGPNLNMLGTREPEKYGSTSLNDLVAHLVSVGKDLGLAVEHFQSNHEGQLIDAIQGCVGNGIEYCVINPGALTHTSVGLRDAFLGTDIPFIEVHISNIHAREEFRQRSYLSDIAQGTICGCGTLGYELALRVIADSN